MISKRDILEAIGADTDDRFVTGMLVGIDAEADGSTPASAFLTVG